MGEGEGKRKAHDPLSGVTGGLILILLGVLFLLTTLDRISWGDWWAYFILGLGCILILEALIRMASTGDLQPVTGKLIGGSVLAIIGAAYVFGMVTWWPMVLIAVGLVIIFTSLARR